ncbi:MAG: pyruvate, phosphate dikinase, partial [Candidatus Diapherotrites archaeon]|nr:pyruvate, phosphate dikinase [Candidatus Diapherotrites archaeon]
MTKYVYSFDEVKNGNSEEAQFLLGNKGAQLAEMVSAGLNVPPGFTISTNGCNEYYALGKKWPQGLEKEVFEQLKKLENDTKKVFGGKENPLLVSVRSGSYVSMPGMMDTILNLGLNDETVLGLEKKTNDRCAWDSYRRFLQMFGDVVLKVEHSDFEKAIQNKKDTKGVEFDTELSVADLKDLVKEFKEIIKKSTGKEFPQSLQDQLKLAINAVFESWNSDRAISYRRINHLRSDAGTGVNIQAMVFGNSGNSSATGVGFTRNPSNGAKENYGEYLINAQGEDVVAGIRTPKAIDEMSKDLPNAYKELVGIYRKLEAHYKDIQDFEFTIEENKLYLLQTRKGKRTAHAAVKIAVDLVKEGVIDEKEALLRVEANSLNQLLHKQLDPIAKGKAKLLAKGLPASPGAAVGKAVFNAEKAHEMVTLNSAEKVILVRNETSPDDIEGMHVSQGILTARGGMTSHAAVVARGMGKCCVAGCQEIKVEEEHKKFTVNGTIVKEGDW